MKKCYEHVGGVVAYPVSMLNTQDYENLYLHCCNMYNHVEQHVTMFNGIHYGYIACSQ